METQPSDTTPNSPYNDWKSQYSFVVRFLTPIISVLLTAVIILFVNFYSISDKVVRHDQNFEHLTETTGHKSSFLEENDVKLMTIMASQEEFNSYIDSTNNLLIVFSIIMTVMVALLGVVAPYSIIKEHLNSNREIIKEGVSRGIEDIRRQSKDNIKIIKTQSDEKIKEIKDQSDKQIKEIKDQSTGRINDVKKKSEEQYETIRKNTFDQIEEYKEDLLSFVSSEKTSLKKSSDRIERLIQEQREWINRSLMDISARLDNIDDTIRIEKLDSESERISEYKKLEENGRATSDTYFSFASFYYKREDFDKAIDYCTKAVANRDNYAVVYPIWADALEAKGQLLKAWEKREKAIMLCTNTQESNSLIKHQDELMNRILSLETPGLKEKLQIEVDGIHFYMILVRKGIFTMGAPANKGEKNAWANESPTHEVFVSDYYIGETVITRSLWNAVMGKTNGSSRNDNEKDDLPMYNISLDECIDFINKLNIKTGYSFKLPTEAQWEFAARGGSKSKNYKFCGSDVINEVCWYGENSGDSLLKEPYEFNKTKKNHCRLHSVKNDRKKCNELGLYGMSGNVWEWCRDRYGYYSADPQVNPLHEDGQECVIRGGGYLSHKRNCRVTSRYYLSPDEREKDLGLRLVIELEDEM